MWYKFITQIFLHIQKLWTHENTHKEPGLQIRQDGSKKLTGVDFDPILIPWS